MTEPVTCTVCDDKLHWDSIAGVWFNDDDHECGGYPHKPNLED